MVYDVLVVGAGFAGLGVIAHLQADGAVRAIALIDPQAPPAGVAYATQRAEHLLNVPADRMGLRADAPDGFARWLATPAGRAAAAPLPPFATFAPRPLYRAYLAGEAARLAGGITTIRGEARAIAHADGAWRVTTTAGTIAARHVALCVGAPLARAATRARGYVHDVGGAAFAAAAAGPGELCVVLGTGLTALDALATLDAQGWPGRACFISRDGRFPAPHADDAGARPGAWAAAWADAWADALAPAGPVMVRAAARPLLAALRAAARAGAPWQHAYDAFRPHVAQLWAALPEAQKARALTRWGDGWSRRRHRAPPESLARVARWRAEGRLETVAGRIEAVLADGPGAIVVTTQGARTRRLSADLAVEARGFAAQACASPLLARLVADGLAAAGPLGLGLAAGADGAVARAPWGEIAAFGPALLGARLETTGAPEIRAQAAAFARRIAA